MVSIQGACHASLYLYTLPRLPSRSHVLYGLSCVTQDSCSAQLGPIRDFHMDENPQRETCSIFIRDPVEIFVDPLLLPPNLELLKFYSFRNFHSSVSFYYVYYRRRLLQIIRLRACDPNNRRICDLRSIQKLGDLQLFLWIMKLRSCLNIYYGGDYYRLLLMQDPKNRVLRIEDKKYSKLRGFGSIFTDRLLRPPFKIIQIKIVRKLLSIINRLYQTASFVVVIVITDYIIAIQNL